MARKQIPCGGFYYDDTQFEFIDYELKSKNGGSGVEKTTYSELKRLRDESKLVGGMQYRITDYDCVVDETIYGIKSAHHPFDIIVTADDESHLNIKARAVMHEGDTYFANSNLEQWEIWYCLDEPLNYVNVNDPEFRGVITRMIDEFNNDVSYDFKNIQFVRYALVDNEGEHSPAFDESLIGMYAGTWLMRDEAWGNPFEDYGIDYNDYVYAYTFSMFDEDGEIIDSSLDGSENYVSGNIFEPCNISKEEWYEEETWEEDGEEFTDIEYWNPPISDTVFWGQGCYANTFGQYCNSNTFGAYCYTNTFGQYCNNNTFGDSCSDNIFGCQCDSNTFVHECRYNTFGQHCHNNTFGQGCFYNTFREECYGNILDFSRRNTFGSGCYHITTEENTVDDCDVKNGVNNCCLYDDSFNYNTTTYTFILAQDKMSVYWLDTVYGFGNASFHQKFWDGTNWTNQS